MAAGPGNHKLSIVTPALGLTATATANLLPDGYRWTDRSAPVDVSVGVGLCAPSYVAGGAQLMVAPDGASLQSSGDLGMGDYFDGFVIGYKSVGGE